MSHLGFGMSHGIKQGMRLQMPASLFHQLPVRCDLAWASNFRCMAASSGREREGMISRNELRHNSSKTRWEGRGSTQATSRLREEAGTQQDGDAAAEQAEDRLAPSSEPRRHEHPSKERQRALQHSHKQKSKRWDVGGASKESSGDWSEYFDEKWVHNSGRLSDWRGPSSTVPPPSRPPRRQAKERRTSRPGGGESSGRRTKRPSPPDDSTLDSLEAIQQAPGMDRWRYFATCHPGLEPAVAAELASSNIRATDISQGQAGVTFWGDGLATGYRACLWLRSAIRVLVLLAEDDVDEQVPAGDWLYVWMRRAVDWPALLGRGQRFSVDARIWSCPTIPSSFLVKTRFRDAISDSIRDARNGQKPLPPDEDHPADLPLFAALFKGRVSLYRDLAGESLHRRGWRAAMHKASLNEAAAAGLLVLAGWPKQGAVLADPMCGSGTLLIEAALMAQNRAPGLSRREWPFFSWPDFRPQQWQQAVAEAQRAQESSPRFQGKLLGNDAHEGALSLARRDAQAAGVSDLITFRSGTCGEWQLQAPPQIVVTNPPWGGRIQGNPMANQINSQQHWDRSHGEGQEGGDPMEASLRASWQDLSAFLKGQCSNATAWVLSGNKDMPHVMRLKSSKRYNLSIGGVECRLLGFDILPPRPY